jgi:NAD(P)-dependent dehydrogenase (short-subunit alcohol dehydrogenase family)
MSTIVITGAGRGIGREMAGQYLAEGHRVIATVRSQEHADELRALGAQTHFVEMTDPQSIAAFGQAVADETIDVLIVNAGIMRQRDMRFSNIDVPVFQECFQVNCIAPALLAGHLLAPVRRSANQGLHLQQRCLISLAPFQLAFFADALAHVVDAAQRYNADGRGWLGQIHRASSIRSRFETRPNSMESALCRRPIESTHRIIQELNDAMQHTQTCRASLQ